MVDCNESSLTVRCESVTRNKHCAVEKSFLTELTLFEIYVTPSVDG
jgi:hypothetical protein